MCVVVRVTWRACVEVCSRCVQRTLCVYAPVWWEMCCTTHVVRVVVCGWCTLSVAVQMVFCVVKATVYTWVCGAVSCGC